MANRVFEDRVGVWVIDADRGVARLPELRAYAGGLIRDVFLPRSSSPEHFAAVRAAGLYAHLWTAPNERPVEQYVAETLADVARLKPGALELNVELGSDAPLKLYVIRAIAGIRAKRKNLRVRINLAAWKGFAVPALELTHDPNLYVCEQTYLGDMSRLSEADVYADALAYGAPAAKLTLCYGAAGPHPVTGVRICTLPSLARRRRGVIFSDDLMSDAGLL